MVVILTGTFLLLNTGLLKGYHLLTLCFRRPNIHYCLSFKEPSVACTTFTVYTNFQCNACFYVVLCIDGDAMNGNGVTDVREYKFF